MREAAKFSDRRQFPRVAVRTRIRVLLRHQRRFLTAEVGDLSAGGMGLTAMETFETGSLVDFEFTLLDEVRPYVGRAEVVWVRSAGKHGGGPFQIGLRFLSIGHKRRDLSMLAREVGHWHVTGFKIALDAMRYAWAELQGNLTDRELGQPGAGFRRPLLLIHGWLGTRGVMSLMERRLKHVGFPVFSIDLGVPNVRRIEASAQLVAEKVERLTKRLGIEQIDILAHSMGGLIALYGLKKLDLAPRVRRLVTVGTPFHGTYAAAAGLPIFALVSQSLRQMLPNSAFLRDLHAGPLPRGVEIYSVAARNDLLAPANRAALEGATNVMVEGSHAALVTSERCYQQILAILEGRDPLAL